MVQTARSRERGPSLANQDDEHSVSAVLAGIINQIKLVLSEQYAGWINVFKDRFNAMIVPAVIEHQALSGYACKQNDGGFWNLSLVQTSSHVDIETLLAFLTKVSKTLKYYYVEDLIYRQILSELIRVVGVTALNFLLLRKNFCTWKRGMQIAYNVSRIEEWCVAVGVGEAIIHLQPLVQASKLLRHNKSSAEDVDEIFDTCFLLNPTQVKKLLTMSSSVDISPLPQVLEAIQNAPVVANDELLLPLENSAPFHVGIERVVLVEEFIPEWLHLPHINAFISFKNESQ